MRPTSERMTDALDAGRDEERRRAVRALLRHPLMTASRADPAAFTLVRRHAGWLSDWFLREVGWSLRVDSTVARLTKVVADPRDPSRPATAVAGQRGGISRSAFSRRRYVLACLALAALERSESQVTLGWLVERVVVLAADEALGAAGVSFQLEGRDERADLAAVARFLLSMGVLRRVAGDEQEFVNATGDVLYDVDRRVLATLLGAGRGPSVLAAGRAFSPDPRQSTQERIDAVLAQPRPDTDDLRNQAIRHRLARRLLDDPILYDADLSEEERAYLRTQRPFLLRRLCEGSGLVAEVRAEGIALIDPTGESTDFGMPEEGTDGHVTLLLAEHLASVLRRPAQPGSADPTAVAIRDLEAHVRSLAAAYRGYWRRDAVEPGAERELVRSAVARLQSLGLLVRCRADGSRADGSRADGSRASAASRDDVVQPLPALARFAFAPARREDAS